MSSNLAFTVAGRTLGLLETKVKDKDHTYFVFRTGDKASFTGESFTAWAASLPTEVVIDGVTIPLTLGLTSATDFKTKAPIAESARRPRVAGSGTAVFPTIGESRMYEVAMSVTKAGTWNLKASVRRTGGGSVSPEDRVKAAQAKARANDEALARQFGTA